ncbi:uncharacterized protein LOC134693838 [Mytilus trossulus]|uniref:uncharacterized protein LOC134693838 n=1 Tax=Mytilus trossulus TaxID=6551 RepID=UPI003005B5CE
MTQIKDLRNEIFHLSDIKELTDNEYNAKWDTLKGSILGIVSLIDKDYEEEITKKIIYTKQLTVIPAYMLNYEILCRDYWRNKCAEFERAQCEEIVEKANALQSKMPRVFSESMEINCQTTMNRIQKFKTCVDKINILIEVFGNHETMKVVTPEEK